MPLSFLSQDVTYAFRQLNKSRSFTIVAILTLALGIGANLSIFLVAYGVLFRPLPFPHPKQLVFIQTDTDTLSLTRALFIRRTSHSFESVASLDFTPGNRNLIRDGNAIAIKILRTTTDYFHVFQMQPKIGRGFSASDMIPNAPGVVVLSDALWRQRFSATPRILGQTITLGNQLYTVIGVAPPQFRVESGVDAWIPLSGIENANDADDDYDIIARLRPGVTYAQAQADLKNVQALYNTAYPKLSKPHEPPLILRDYHDYAVNDVRPALLILMGAVALVLLIVAANILSLLLTRAIGRRREISLRAALGASGWRILCQLLVENLLLCVAGGVAGVLLAQLITPALLHLNPLDLPDFISIQMGGAALAFAAGLTVVCALVFSLVPAFETRRKRLNESLRLNTTQIATGRQFVQKALVVSEVTISLVLLASAMLLLASFWKLVHTSPGFDARNVLTFKNGFTDQQAATSGQFGPRLDAITARLEALPGIAAAAAVTNLPSQVLPYTVFDVIGRSAERSGSGGTERLRAIYMSITAHYFDALGVPVIAGRAFNQSDNHGSPPVLIVSQQFVRTYFKDQNPIGQHIRLHGRLGTAYEEPVREIVGVVGDVKQNGLERKTPSIVYLEASQSSDGMTQMLNSILGMSWIVRTKSAHVDVTTPARRIFMENAQSALLSVEPLSEVVNASVAQQRFNTILLSSFGLLSLLLGAAGLYGVMSYTVARQTREIGVRMAIGARRGDIARMVLRDAGKLVILGLIFGVVASLAGAHLLQSLIFGIAPRNPFALASACAALLITGLFAAWWPARQAASIEPMEALRAE